MDTRTSGAAESALALPNGGGGLAALGETFKVDLNSGGGTFAVALELPPGRGGLGPRLALQYSTGSGNSAFGLGWQLGVGDISRKTSAGTPSYDDRDTYVMGGADDLVDVGGGRFRPRVEGAYSRIQRITAPDGLPCFVVTTRDGVRHSFGTGPQTRLDHPDRPGATLRWLPAESVEPNGSRIVYGWRHDDAAVQTYLSRIDYVDYSGDRFLFRVRFDYGDLDDEGAPARDWPVRPDPFSTYRPGFEVRTQRLCRRILLQVQPPGADDYRVVRRWELQHEPSEPDGVSLLTGVTQIGVRRDPAGDVELEAHPPLRFGYSTADLRRPRLVPLTAHPGYLPPGTLSEPTLDLVDLTGDGLPDLLDRGGLSPRWWRNTGQGRFVGPLEMDRMPAEAGRAGVDLVVADLDGTGSADLYIQDGPRATYWRNRFTGGFDEPVALDRAPNLRVPGRQYLPMELTGDGAVDLLALGDDRTLYFHAAERPAGGAPPRSFTPGAAVRFEPDGDSRLPGTDPSRLRLADMTGDGSMALVLLASGRITYRPYLGGGRWGAEVVMRQVPIWSAGLDPRAVLLADVTGTGCADLVVLDGRHVRVAVNRSGNGFGPLLGVAHLPPVDLDAARVADLLGTGTAGIVLALPGAAGATAHRFLDVSGGTRPGLLSRIDNGFGGLVTVAYRSAVTDRLRDGWSANGTGRAALPMPVPVVASIETDDAVTGARTRVEYRYHDGLYDGTEREFRGFAMVEETEPGGRGVAGVLRRTWFHPGAERDHADRPLPLLRGAAAGSALHAPPVTLPEDAASRAECVRALKGMHLRTEVYNLDVPGPPLVVRESAYDVVEIVPGRPGVSAPRLRETVTARDEDDGVPRKLTRTELDYDAYGNPARRRTSGGPDVPDGTLPTVQTIEETQHWHHRDEPDPAPDLTAPYRLTYQVDRAYEVLIEEIDGGDRRLLSHRRTYYDGPDFAGRPLTTQPSRGNPVRVEDLVLTDELIAQAWGTAVPAAAVASSGLQPEGDPGTRRWWRQVERRAVDARGQVLAVLDPIGARRDMTFDAAGWRITAVTDATGTTQQAEVDYQALGVARHIDANERHTVYAYTPLGRLRGIARRGRPRPDGTFPGDTPEAPTVAFTYRTDPVDRTNPNPVGVEIANRITTGGPETVRTYEYTAGFGEIAQKRLEQRPGEVDGDAGLPQAWIVSGLEERGPRGLVHAVHAPTVDDRPDWRVTQAMRDAPAGRVHSDALGRLIQGVAPDGSRRRVVHGTWHTGLHDENDEAGATLDPQIPEQAELLQRLAAQLETPQVQLFDAYDRLCEVAEDLGGGQMLRTRYRYDGLGRPVEVRDAADRVAVQATYDYTGQVIAYRQIDVGTHRFCYDALGALVLRVDARGRRLRTTHDQAGRVADLLDLPVTASADDAWDSPQSRLTVRHAYGESNDPAALAAGAVGRPIRILDPAGSVEFTYDGRGNRASVTRRFFAVDPDAELDPGFVPPPVDVRPLETAEYRVDYEHDATGWLRQVTYPDAGAGRATVRLDRTKLGLLRAATYEPADGPEAPIIRDTRYDARTRRVGLWFGNGLGTVYRYGTLNPRLTELVTGVADPGEQPAGEPLLSLGYHYDPVGNPLTVQRGDDARAYSYDALHRLTHFDAREYAYDVTGNLTVFGDHEGPPPQHVPGTNRLAGLGYDAGGAIISAPHLPVLHWDERGHLSYLENTAGGVARYTYDHSGERRRKLVRDGTRVRDLRWIDGVFEVEQVTEAGAVVEHRSRAYVLGQLEVAAVVVDDLRTGDRAVRYLHGDHLTSVLCTTDETGQPVQQRDYLPYGLIAASVGDGVEHGFTGALLDPESGLILLSRRYYDPTTGRFLSPDPMLIKYLDGRNAQGIFRPGNLNPYAYAAGNPLVYYDPSGNFIFIALIIAGAGLLLAGVGVAMQNSNNEVVRGFGKAFEIIGLVAAGAALGAIGGAFIAGLGSFIFGGVTLGAAFAGSIGATTIGALSTAGLVGAIAGGVVGAAHGAITGAFGVYDLGSPTGYLAFIMDTSWGISQTTLGVIGITIGAIGGGSVNQPLSERTNVLAMENTFVGGGVSLGPYVMAGGTFDPELIGHESFHTLQNRIFGPIFTFTVIPLTIITNIITAIAPPRSNPGFVDVGEPPNWDNWLNPWETWAEAAV